MLGQCPTPSPSPINPLQSSSVLSEPPCTRRISDDDVFQKNPKTGPPGVVGGGGVDAWPDGLAPPDAVTWASVFADAFGVVARTSQPREWAKFAPLAMAWCTAGVTVGQMRAAVARAQAEATEPIAYLPSYADRVLAGMVPRQPRPKEVAMVDPDGRSSVEAEGVAKGIGRWDEMRENWFEYKRRVRGGTVAGFAGALVDLVGKGLAAK